MTQNKIIFSKDGTIYMDSSMSHSAFAKSRFSVKLEEEGFLATRQQNSWSFSPWRFTGTQSSSFVNENLEQDSEEELSPALRAKRLNETVFLEGSAFDGFTLKDYIDLEKADSTSDNKKILCEVSALVIDAIESALCQSIQLKALGGGGIFISNDKTKIIFLPEDVFTTCVTCFGDETYSNQSGVFVQPNLEGNASLNYLESVIAYRALAGKFPFESLNSTQRHEDCLDRNFLPLKDAIWGLDGDLSFFIDNALCRKQKITQHKKNRKGTFASFGEQISGQIKEGNDSEESPSSPKIDFVLHFPLDTFKKETGIDGNPPAERKARISKEEFEINSNKNFEKFQKKLSIKRWFRKNSGIITGVAIAVIAVGTFAGVWVNGNQSRPTAVSLTSFETVELFMSSINCMDVSACQASGKGQHINSMVNSISTYYVASQTRSAYSGKDATVSPAEWFIHNVETNYNIWGIARLEIDGKQGDLFFKGPKKLTHPKPLSQEDGKPLVKGQQKTYTVNYRLLFNDDPEILEDAIHSDTVVVEWTGKKWQVMQFEQSFTLERENLTEFKSDYTAALAEGRKRLDESKEVPLTEETEANQNLLSPVGLRNSRLVPEAEEAAQILSEKYSFIPTQPEIAGARLYVAEKYDVDLR